MKTQEPFKWGFLRWQRMSQKQRTAVFYFYRTIQPQRPHDPEQVYPSRIAKLRAERINAFSH